MLDEYRLTTLYTLLRITLISKGASDETDLSAKPAYSQAPAWISRPYGDCWGPQGSEPPPRAWPQEVVGLRQSMSFGRLKKRAEFLAVAEANRKFVTYGVIVQLMKRPEPAVLRIGYTVSRKVGNAVARNRARRRLREAAALTLRDVTFPCDLVLIGRPATLTRSWEELTGDLRFAFTKLGIVK